MSTTAQPNKVQNHQQVVKSRDRPRSLRMNDDTTMIKQILATHAPDGREVEVKPIVQVIEEVVKRCSLVLGALYGNPPQVEVPDDRSSHDGLRNILEDLAYTINKISCEISCKCSGGGDVHSTTTTILNMLSHYSWDAKVVLSLAAFAANYGEFWLVIQLYPTNPLANSVALLKQMPDIIEDGNSLKSQFEALSKLIKVMLDVTKCVVEFKELPSDYISEDVPPLSSALAHIPTATYWTIRAIVACASQIISLIGMSVEHILLTNESWELSTLAHKIGSIHEHLMVQLQHCHRHIEDKKVQERFYNLVRLAGKPLLRDNLEFLELLIDFRKDKQPLAQNGNKVNIEVLRQKTVLLLISDLHLSHEEIEVLGVLYEEAKAMHNIEYEVVWLPVVNDTKAWTEADKNKFNELQKFMPWYTVVDPSSLDPAVVKYIKDVWHFTKKAILVVLNVQGKEVSRNALHMMWIWGNSAYPFSDLEEESLWKKESWKLKLLVDDIDKNILQWMDEEKHICLYGGENTEWILKFNEAARQVASTAGIELEMVYVGKSNAKEQVRKIIAFIAAQNLGYCWSKLIHIWFFWTRLESMLYSKTQPGKTLRNDPILVEVQMMLSFDGSDQGWAVFSRGNAEMARAKGDTILKCLTKFTDWREKTQHIGFIPTLIEHLDELHTPEHCNRLILPGINGDITETVVCAECGRPMEKYFMYRCCND